MRKMIVVDEERCLACKQCMIECAMAHTEARTLVEALSSDTPPQPRVHVESSPTPQGDWPGHFGMPLQCRHCEGERENAPCMAVCPTEAIDRASDQGPVLLDQERCIGCKFCMLVCPFGVIDLSRDGKAMVKCDMCVERTETGQEPACVAGCPTGAMQFRDIDEWLTERRRRAAEQVSTAQDRAGESAR